MPLTGSARAPRRGAGGFAAVFAAVLLAVLALVAHHGMVSWQGVQGGASTGTAAAVAEAPHTHSAPADPAPAAPEHADTGHTATELAFPDRGGTAGGPARAGPALADAGHSGHDHADQTDQGDCGPATGTCQSAKTTVDVALPPRTRLVLPVAAPVPRTILHVARAALPAPPDLAELSILRV